MKQRLSNSVQIISQIDNTLGTMDTVLNAEGFFKWYLMTRSLNVITFVVPVWTKVEQRFDKSMA